MGRTILLHPERMGPVFNEAIFICWNLVTKISPENRIIQCINPELATTEIFHQTEAYEVLADITFRMEKLPVAGSVVCMIFMYSKLPERKAGISYFVKSKHVSSESF